MCDDLCQPRVFFSLGLSLDVRLDRPHASQNEHIAERTVLPFHSVGFRPTRSPYLSFHECLRCLVSVLSFQSVVLFGERKGFVIDANNEIMMRGINCTWVSGKIDKNG